ncbi:unnamed protein product [Coffea canephora]|uniref:DH200=94 genomic scaffold, scaffold_202 n=1 Tax=Coffea canephora TaxID=49390 RepID=A0A068VB56_COFCA|nr:unnamed protein product [Coffea canephora]
MYGSRNYATPADQGPYPPLQHCPPAPPPAFSRSSHLPLPTAIQQSRLQIPLHVGHLGHPVYQYTPSGTPQQGPLSPVLSSGINSQPFFALPPPPAPQPLQVPGNSRVQLPLQWTHTTFVSPTGPPSVSRVLPQPPSQGQTQFSSQVHQAQAGSMQPQVQPNPPASSLCTSPPVGSFKHSMPQLSTTAPAGPPALPPPPPLPSPPGSPPTRSSSPPPTSLSTFSKSCTLIAVPAASKPAYHHEIGSRDNKSSSLETSDQVGDAVHDGEAGGKSVSALRKNLISDLPSPPPKPADDRTVHSIEVLCQYIAKNGPEFEILTRQKESGNPEFKFLFGGQPGSETAVAHEYFLWTKRKYLLGSGSVENQGDHDLLLRPSGRSASQLKNAKNVSPPYSPVDSDMDMEDDITHPDEEPQNCTPNEISHEIISVSNRLDKWQELQPLPGIAEHSLAKDASDETLTYSGWQVSEELIQGAGISSDQNRSIIRKSVTKLGGLIASSSGDVENLSTSNVTKTSELLEVISQTNTSAHLAEVRLEKLPTQLVTQGGSPFTLLQDYASNESSDDEAHLVPTTAALSVKRDSVPLDTDFKVDWGTDLGAKSALESHKGLEQLPQSSILKPESVVVEAEMPYTTGKPEDFVDNTYGNQESPKGGMPQREYQQKVFLIDDANFEKQKVAKSFSSTSKLDKFGRLIKAGASDSESDGSPCFSRRQGKRSRNRSRSRSPHDTRWRRSPWRRREKRGRSRSLSPKRRRSRSRSPLFQHGEDKMRRDKSHRSECFDFIRGKCYRGASCRYLHCEDKSDRSRSYKRKEQFQDLPYSSRSSDLHEKTEIPYKKLSREHDGGRIQQLKPQKVKANTDGKKHTNEEMNEAVTCFPDKSGPVEPLVNPILEANIKKIPGIAAHCRLSPSENLDVHQSQGNSSDQFLRNADYQHQQRDASCHPKCSPVHASASDPSPHLMDKSCVNEEGANESRVTLSTMNETLPCQSVSSQPMVHKESISSDHRSHLPLSFALVSQDTSSSINQEMPRDYNLISPAGVFPSHSSSVESRHLYQPSVCHSHSQFPFRPNPTWSSVPPPSALYHHPPPPSAFVSDRNLTPGPYTASSAHTMQNMLPRTNDFSSQTSARPFLTEFRISSVGKNQVYPPMQEPNRPPDQLNDLHPRTFPVSQPSQSHGRAGLVGEGQFTGQPGPGLYSSNSFDKDKKHSQTMPFSRESPLKRAQAFPSDTLPPVDGVSSIHHEHGNLSSTMPSYTTDFLDRNQPSVLSDTGISRISDRFNPYACTFDQPLSSKFSCSSLLQERDRPFGNQLGAAYSFSQVPVAGRDIANHDSGNLMSSQNSAQPLDGISPQPGDGQYDPIYDSIEPSLNSVRKSNYGQKHEITDESDVIVRSSGSNKPLDKKEHKLKGAVCDEEIGSLENDEYGETADGEVGAVENGSPSNLNDAAETAAGEVEIDQVKAPGKSKKSKDSRSMKLFKVALADFVKEVLKPSWRQGSMSKEAFKTIVKKTVDRVSGAMKSHHIPKSQAKIDHYIDSSQRKLTKLVMGYVDKYVKV